MCVSWVTCLVRSDAGRSGKASWGRQLYFKLAAVLVVSAFGNVHAAPPAEVPTIDAKLGPCTADFTILDSSDNPIYDAKIFVSIPHGFVKERTSDLEISTDSDGKARFEGLPEKLKKPALEFKVRSGDLKKYVKHDPAADCHPNFTIALGKP